MSVGLGVDFFSESFFGKKRGCMSQPNTQRSCVWEGWLCFITRGSPAAVRVVSTESQWLDTAALQRDVWLIFAISTIAVLLVIVVVRLGPRATPKPLQKTFSAL